ncbi:alpha/beta hydrolase [Mesorhizobium marinum]|uniref:alpha/beta hydrolase n=1 Tax=Mesorhizobium marinum TaxID=3228790 RepID=UPI003467AF84
MSFDKIVGLIASLLAGDPVDPAFERLSAGGYNATTPVTMRSCPRPLGLYEIERKTLFCGAVSVPEDHARPDGRRIELAFAIMKSHSSYPEPDPLVYLHGGPGTGNLEGLRGFAKVFDKFRQNRDVIMFDERAAGLSGHSTTCYEALTTNILDIARKTAEATTQKDGDTSPSKLAADCISELRASGIDLAKYNTYENALDVRAVVTALGYESYNLYGISYGTKLALEVMRSVPEGVRAVIIDGVAPPSVHLYDTLAQPGSEAVTFLLDQCRTNPACDSAYPELNDKLRQAFTNAAEGKIVVRGKKMPPQFVQVLFDRRNGDREHRSYTPYLPAVIYEMARGENMPTLEMLVDEELSLPRYGIADARKLVATRGDEEQRYFNLALAEAEATKGNEASLELTISELKDALHRSRVLGPLASLFDEEMSRASQPVLADPEKAKAALADMAALQNKIASKDELRRFVGDYFSGESQARLLALIDAMSETELRGVFSGIRTSVGKAESGIVGSSHLWIYACQEDLPYNTLEQYKKVTAGLEWPQIGIAWDGLAEEFYAVCRLFEPQPRAGFHDPVVSDIPTLAIGSAWDTQTAASWAKLATDTLPRSQSFVIPEAGHGAIAYQPCVAEMGAAFINNPARTLDDRCPASLKPDFHIAPWAGDETSADKAKAN